LELEELEQNELSWNWMERNIGYFCDAYLN